MNVDTIREFCLTFPQATENLQWSDSLCFKIRGKIFAIVSLDDPRLCFKCAPEIFSELLEREDIRPAPYVGRYKWVMLDRLDAVRSDELKELIGSLMKWWRRRRREMSGRVEAVPSRGRAKRRRRFERLLRG
jgi:predicted DNA-binding protein (MmcQ/YjbR family)